MRAEATAAAPRISVILSFRDGGVLLDAAVASLQWQTEPDWELIAIDDGSRDGSADLPRLHDDARIRLIRHSASAGLPRRLNEGVAMARGRYIARMDADDVSFPQRMKAQADFLDQHPDVDLVAASILIIDEEGFPLSIARSPTGHEQIVQRACLRFPMPHPTWMGRTVWFRAHAYDERAVRAEDQHLLYRTYRQSRFAALTEPLLAYRWARLSAYKSLQGRFSFLQAVWRHGSLADACLGSALHAAAALRDLSMIALGRDRDVIRRHGEAVPDTLAQEWSSLKQRLAIMRSEC
jgi:glycosyltransferase involved in cell wall biosynthesis